MEIAALVISGVSLLLALVSFIVSIRAQHLQNRVNELELKIKEFELAERESAEAEKNKSCVEARMVRISKGKYRLKVWNSGNTSVYNVSATRPNEYGIMLYNDDKMPYEFLDPQKGFDIVSIVHMGSSSKFLVTTEWTDAAGIKQKKEQLCDI